MASSSVPVASCAVCRDNLDEVSDLAAIGCGHVFHVRCISEWLKQSPTCPQCRKHLRNPQKETMRIFLSFGSADADSTDGAAGGGDGADGAEPPGLAELRKRLATVSEEAESAKQRLKQLKHRDARMKRDLGERQRRISAFEAQLETCQESMAQQVHENRQLMQLLAQEYQSQAELAHLRDRIRQLEEQCETQEGEIAKLTVRGPSEAERRIIAELARLRAENSDLEDRLQMSQQETALLQAARDSLTDEVLAREAESFRLSKMLTSGHEQNSLLTRKLQQAQETAMRLAQKLSLGSEKTAQPDCGDCAKNEFSSMPVVLTD